MEKINNPYTAIDRACKDLIGYLKTIPYENFDDYPNLWCPVLKHNLEADYDGLFEEYGTLLLPFISSWLHEYCEPSVINWLYLEHHNAFNDPGFDRENADVLNTDNYKTFPYREETLDEACIEVIRNFNGWDNYDPLEEQMEGYKERVRQEQDSVAIILKELIRFRDERDWNQFHNPKDLALALNIEAGELLESFLWKEPEKASRVKVKEELADVFSFAFLLAEKYGFNIKEMIMEKIEANRKRYPVDKSKGNAKKYNEL